ncbi:MAG: 16S rRNA (adenine(1518)-N(6)/adenine(1519)-N(6))-dimethyltransferase RsmA, partial [Bacteroidia bacterium]
AIDIDHESVLWLKIHFPELGDYLIEGDFLKMNVEETFKEKFSLIGNFPYNISSQIVFKILEHKDRIPLMVGMFQKEVAERYCANPKSKEYGITSVLTQAYYQVEYLFSVNENVFDPPPKVKSGVIRLMRKEKDFEVDEKLLFKVVKAAFNQRRKKLRNAISQFGISDEILEYSGFAGKRAEELSVDDFVELTHLVKEKGINK